MKKISFIFSVILLLVSINLVIGTSSYGKDTKVTSNSKTVAELEKEVKRLKSELEVSLKHCPANAKPLKLTVTAAVIGPKLHTTALGKKVKPGWCAVSQDLAYLVGKSLYIPGGIGKTKVACVMPSKWKKSIDYYVISYSRAKKIGRSVRPVAVL